MKFKAAIVQANTPNDIDLANEQIAALVNDAARAGANFIATPEGSNLLERDSNRFKEICPIVDDEVTLKFYSDLAKVHNIHLLIGSAVFQAKEGKAFNRSLLFNPIGELIAQYDKIHLFDVELGNGLELKESRNFQAGSQTMIAKTDIGNFGLSICYDIRFPHLYRALTQNGSQILCIPAAFTVPTGKAHWEVLLRARAIENGAYVIAPAQVGKHKDGRETFGHSMIINPWGEVIAKIDSDNIGYALAEIDLNQVTEARQKIPAWSLNRDFKING